MNMNITNNNDVNNNNSTNNNNNNINEEKKEEKQKEENSPENKHSRARNLRNSLKKRNKEKLELLRKYFNKFHQAGILLALRKTIKLASLYKKIENVDFGTAMNTIVNSETMNDIEIHANSTTKDLQDALNKKMEDKKFAEEMEKIKIEEEKMKKEEEQKMNELKAMRQKAIEIIFYKADRHNKLQLKKQFDIYYLKSKVLSLNDYPCTRPRRTRTIRKREKAKEKEKEKEKAKETKKRCSLFMGEDKKIVNKMMNDKPNVNNNKINEIIIEDENDNKKENDNI